MTNNTVIQFRNIIITIVILIGISYLISFYSAKIAAGFFAITMMIFLVAKFSTFSDNIKRKSLSNKWDKATADLIMKKVVIVGMTRQMVKEIWGDEYNVRSQTKQDGDFDTIYYKPIPNMENKFEKYAIFLNGKTIEFGDN